MIKVLFVCTGNTCRSPMAEGLMNCKAKKLKLPIKASSAGIFAFTGDDVSRNSVLAMGKIGIDISTHRAKKITIYDIESADLIVPMNTAQGAVLKNTAEDKLWNFSHDIPDPYGKDEQAYIQCRNEISAEIDLLFDFLQNRFGKEISPMRKDDCPAVAEIEKECFSHPWSEKALLEETENSNAHFFVFKSYGEILGYIGFHAVAQEAYIANVAVKKSARNNGIATALVSFATKKAKDMGCDFISLEVRKSNTAAINIYQKCGFKKAGERKNFYRDPDEDGEIWTVTY